MNVWEEIRRRMPADGAPLVVTTEFLPRPWCKPDSDGCVRANRLPQAEANKYGLHVELFSNLDDAYTIIRCAQPPQAESTTAPQEGDK